MFERIDVPRGATLHTEFLAMNRSGKVDVIVELDGATLADRVAAARAQGRDLSKAERTRVINGLEADQRPSVNRARNAGATVKLTYQGAFNGFSASVARADLAALAAVPGVVAIHPVRQVERNNERSVPYIGTPAAWEDLGLTGAGISIGIIDTGLDYQHANFGGDGTDTFPTAKVAGGYDFVGDDYSGPNTPVPDDDPMDCNGHGSHVGGTAAGFGVLATGATYTGTYDADTIADNEWNIGPGVAPDATLYGYRVFGCEGFTTSDIIVAAIDMALEDGVDVINMSLGSSFGPPDEPDGLASNAAAEAGMMVVASAGNSGPSAYITGSPASATRVLSVAAMDGGFATIPTAEITITGVGTLANNNNSDELPVTAEIMVLPDQGLVGPGVGGISLGCDESEYAGTAGKIVVTVRGVCARVDRAIFGQNAGAAAVVMINNSASLPPFEGPIPGVTLAFLGAAGTAAVRTAFLGADGDVHTVTETGSIPSPSYKGLASFSSGGPRNTDSAFKPDITAPGVSTVSTNVGTGTGGVALSGTSMAAPHAAGVAALVIQKNPTWSPEAVKAAMMNTANASTSVLTATGSTAAANVRLAGSGLVQPRRAVDTLVYATTGPGQASLSYGYEPLSGAYSETLTITFHNTDSVDHDFDLSNAFQAALGADLSFSSSSVTVPGDGTAEVEVTLSLSAGAVAALPAASASNFGGLQTIRGAVTASPDPGGVGLYDLRIPFLLAPRGLSDVTVGTPSAYSFPGTVRERTAELTNSGIHGTIADVYSWGATDGADGLGAIDIRNVGVQSLPGELVGEPASDRLLIFAINVDGMWSNAAANEYDIVIDHNNDGKADYLVVGVDLGAVLLGSFNGQMASFIFQVSKQGGLTLVGIWVATAPMNGSTILLPALASEIGLTPNKGNTKFRYQVVTFQIFDLPGTAFDVAPWAEWDSHRPPTSTGDFIPLAPGASADLTMTVDIARNKVVKTLGWMVVALDDANGTPQTDTVPLGKP